MENPAISKDCADLLAREFPGVENPVESVFPNIHNLFGTSAKTFNNLILSDDFRESYLELVKLALWLKTPGAEALFKEFSNALNVTLLVIVRQSTEQLNKNLKEIVPEALQSKEIVLYYSSKEPLEDYVLEGLNRINTKATLKNFSLVRLSESDQLSDKAIQYIAETINFSGKEKISSPHINVPNFSKDKKEKSFKIFHKIVPKRYSKNFYTEINRIQKNIKSNDKSILELYEKIANVIFHDLPSLYFHSLDFWGYFHSNIDTFLTRMRCSPEFSKLFKETFDQFILIFYSDYAPQKVKYFFGDEMINEVIKSLKVKAHQLVMQYDEMQRKRATSSSYAQYSDNVFNSDQNNDSNRKSGSRFLRILKHRLDKESGNHTQDNSDSKSEVEKTNEENSITEFSNEEDVSKEKTISLEEFNEVVKKYSVSDSAAQGIIEIINEIQNEKEKTLVMLDVLKLLDRNITRLSDMDLETEYIKKFEIHELKFRVDNRQLRIYFDIFKNYGIYLLTSHFKKGESDQNVHFGKAEKLARDFRAINKIE